MKELMLITRSIPMCGECVGLKLGLHSKGIPYREIDITHNPEAVEKYGVTGIPVSIIQDEEGAELSRLVGARPPELLEEMLK